MINSDMLIAKRESFIEHSIITEQRNKTYVLSKWIGMDVVLAVLADQSVTANAIWMLYVFCVAKLVRMNI